MHRVKSNWGEGYGADQGKGGQMRILEVRVPKKIRVDELRKQLGEMRGAGM